LGLLIDPEAGSWLAFGPAVHWIAGYYTNVLHVASKVKSGELDPPFEASNTELVGQLHRLREPLGQFLQSVAAINQEAGKVLEAKITARYTLAWNVLIASLDPNDWPLDLRSSLIASHLQPLRGTEHVDILNSMYRAAGMKLQQPLKMIEAKQTLSLAELGEGAVVYQVENEIARIDALHQLATGKELRVPFFLERFSRHAFYMDLIVPCHRGDPIVTRTLEAVDPQEQQPQASTPSTPKRSSRTAVSTTPRLPVSTSRRTVLTTPRAKAPVKQAKKPSTDRAASKAPDKSLDSVMVRVPLAKLGYLPSSDTQVGFSLWAAQLLSMKALVHMNQSSADMPRTTWHRPTRQLVEDEAWEPVLHVVARPLPTRPVLICYKNKITGKQIMVKTFDYYFRGPLMPDRSSDINHAQARQPLDEVLLAALQSAHPQVYGSWEVTRFHPLYCIMQYDYIRGNHTPHNWPQFIKAVEIVCTAHTAGYVMGDILAQNILFHSDTETATVIDWDMARAIESNPNYTNGFIVGDHKKFRHMAAKAGAAMELSHDCWSLAKLAEAWFEGDSAFEKWTRELQESDKVTLELVAAGQGFDCTLTPGHRGIIKHTTGSPGLSPPRRQ
jgi:hypothetical protein